ncbi:MAG TPA: DUF294 nucleotidyltransferase-like domain-containing protein, partial [Rhizobiaceae bacterium]|nr:DUF294 nucleotidyltransferase-like domain-containing protein [Rhizobiaceae bacterium]
RLLASLANPAMQDYSLDGIARWLGVSTEGRHNAVSDARIAGEVFLALVPHLTERGIRTLAEAENACSQLTETLKRHHGAGWSEPFRRPAGEAGRFSGMDPFAFRHKIGELMAADLAIAEDGASVLTAAREMTERQVSSLFVRLKDGAGMQASSFGIVTERDVMRAIARQGADALDAPVVSIAASPLKTVNSDLLAYRAIGLMNRLKIRHLAVVDEEGALVGAVSARDMLKLRSGAAVDMHDRIETATDDAALASAWAMLPHVARSLLAEQVDARTVTGIVSSELCALTSRAAAMAQDDMAQAGEGEPPCRYSVLVLGSGGRGESLLAADQDNAIVFESGEPGSSVDEWFARLGARMAQHLHAAAVPLCKGGVMASNLQWRGSVETWRSRIAGWVGKSRPEDLLNVDIFFDITAVHGDLEMANALRDYAWETGRAEVSFAKLLGERIRPQAAPITLFGGFRTESGRIDLKMHGLFPIVAAARALAIRHGVARHSTAARLDALVALPDVPATDLVRLRDAHGEILELILQQQVLDIAAGVTASNRIDPSILDQHAKASLKSTLQGLSVTPDVVRTAMFA